MVVEIEAKDISRYRCKLKGIKVGTCKGKDGGRDLYDVGAKWTWRQR